MMVWMVDITYVSRVWRFATRSLRVEVAQGQWEFYAPGLRIEWVDRWEMGCELSPRRFDQELLWPDVVAHASRDFPLEEATWSLYRAPLERPWARTLVLTGHIESVEYGNPTEPVRFTMTHRLQPLLWPPQLVRINSGDWSASGTPPVGVTELQAESAGQPYTIPVGYTPLLPGNLGIWPLNLLTQAGVREFESIYEPPYSLSDGAWYSWVLDSATVQSTYPVTMEGVGADSVPWSLSYTGAEVENDYIKVVNHGAQPWVDKGYQLTLVTQAKADGVLNSITSYRQEAWLSFLLDADTQDTDLTGTHLSAASEVNNPWTETRYCSDTDLPTADTNRWLSKSVASDYTARYIQLSRYQIADEVTNTGAVEGQVDVTCEDTRRLRYTKDGGTYLGSSAFVPDPVSQPYSLLASNPIRLSIALLQRTGLAYDLAAWEALEEHFATWQFGWYLTSEPNNLLTVAQDQLWQWMPMMVYWGPRGVTPRLWLPDAAPVGTWTVGRGVQRLGSVRRAGRDIYNSVCLSFNRSWAQIDPPHRSRVALGPNTANNSTAPWVRESYHRLGQRDYRLIDSDSIRGSEEVDGGAAWGWLSWFTRYHARDPQVVRYFVEGDRELTPGTVVLITDPELYYYERRAFITEVIWLESGYEVKVEILPMVAPVIPDRDLMTESWTLEPGLGAIALESSQWLLTVDGGTAQATWDGVEGYDGPSGYINTGATGNITVHARIATLTGSLFGGCELGLGLQSASRSTRLSVVVSESGICRALNSATGVTLASTASNTVPRDGTGWVRIQQSGGVVTFQYGVGASLPTSWTTVHTLAALSDLPLVHVMLRQTSGSGYAATVGGRLDSIVMENGG